MTVGGGGLDLDQLAAVVGGNRDVVVAVGGLDVLARAVVNVGLGGDDGAAVEIVQLL
jgi:hypothetical protein